MLQNAWLTWRNAPSGVMTTRRTDVRSKASRTRSKSMRGGSRTMALIDRALPHSCCAGRRVERRAADGLPEARAQPLRQLLEHAFLGGEIDDLLRLDHLARHVVEAAQSVGEPELHALLAGPDQSREHVGRLLQAVAAPLPHDGDELLVDLREHLLRVILVRGILGRERIGEILVLARGVGAPLDAELL